MRNSTWISCLAPLRLSIALAAGCADPSSPAIVADPAGPPLATLEPAAMAEYSGVVRECLRAGAYTYFDVEIEGGARRWAVVMAPALAAGTRVQVGVFGSRTDFVSPRLGRRFSTLDFARITVA